MIVKPGLKKYQKMADIHGLFLTLTLTIHDKLKLCYLYSVYFLFHSFPAFVLQRFPHLSQAAFGAAVNSFLGEKPNAIHQIEVKTFLINFFKNHGFVIYF